MKLHECKLIADVTLISEGEVLFVKYKNIRDFDMQKGWFLPEDLLKENEHPEDAALRILNEQLGLTNTEVVLNHIESFTGKDKSWHLAFHYKTEIPFSDELIVSDRISEHDFFSPADLPDNKFIAHNGWAAFTVKAVLG
ncbi:MAG: hypothetical protein HGGPFJEG_01423 [Ignavibacteria bacterium]|nr:hypothetical protein [Ignavibacteria bacterium]